MTGTNIALRVLAGMILGALIGMVLMNTHPLPIQPGDTLLLDLPGGREMVLAVADKDQPRQEVSLRLPDGLEATAVLSTGQRSGVVRLPDGREIVVAGLGKSEAARTLGDALGTEVVRLSVGERKTVKVIPTPTRAVFIIGELFIRLLRMLIVPLIVATVLVGIASIGDFRRVGRVFWQTFAFYIGTMGLAAILGLTLINLFEPGRGLQLPAGEQPAALLQQAPSVSDLILRIVPPNPVEAIVQMDVLGMLFFTIILALAILKAGKKKSAPVFNFFEGLNDLVYVIIGWVMALAPIGVGALVAYFVGIQDLESLSRLLEKLGKFALLVVAGLLIHFAILSLLVWILGKYNPFSFIKKVLPALVTALGTDSSSATLPVTMSVVPTAGVSKRIYGFVVPVGATANMDGTALYEASAALFFAQAYGVDLGLGQQAIVVITAVLAAMGAAGIPSAGLITMALVLTAVGLPLAGIALLFAIDRPIDMVRTMVNVYGDCVTSRVVQTWNPAIKPEEDDLYTEYVEIEPAAAHGDRL